MIYKCPICNYDGLFEEPYNAQGFGSDEICPCCGFQFGCDDFPDKEEAQKRWRDNWVSKGCPWFSKSRTPPKEWSPKKQLSDC